MAARIDRPQPGFYRTRLVKNGPWVAARIWLDDSIPERPAVLLAEMGGKEVDAFWLWTRVIDQPISEAEFQFLTADAEWCSQHAPTEPAANPTKSINLRTAEMPF